MENVFNINYWGSFSITFYGNWFTSCWTNSYMFIKFNNSLIIYLRYLITCKYYINYRIHLIKIVLYKILNKYLEIKDVFYYQRNQYLNLSYLIIGMKINLYELYIYCYLYMFKFYIILKN
jgi:hypothetical protein